MSCLDYRKVYDSIFYLEENQMVDYSNTNAKIDFDDAYSGSVSRCDFSNTDLSESNISCLCEFRYCNLSGTHIDAGNDISELPTFNSCNLTGFDLSGLTIDLSELQEYFENSILTDTKICILFSDEEECDSLDINHFKESMKKNALIGCYVNGKLIHNSEDQKKNKKEVLTKYAAYKKEVFNAVKTSLEEQIESQNARPRIRKKKTSEN